MRELKQSTITWLFYVNKIHHLGSMWLKHLPKWVSDGNSVEDISHGVFE